MLPARVFVAGSWEFLRPKVLVGGVLAHSRLLPRELELLRTSATSICRRNLSQLRERMAKKSGKEEAEAKYGWPPSKQYFGDAFVKVAQQRSQYFNMHMIENESAYARNEQAVLQLTYNTMM